MEKMASSYDNVQVSILSDDERFVQINEEPLKLDLSRQSDTAVLCFTKGGNKIHQITVTHDTDFSRYGKQSMVFTNEDKSSLVRFHSIHNMKQFQFKFKEMTSGLKSVFTERTDEASAVQYFQFYGYLSQQQNMMQDYIRTSTYQRAILANLIDFHDKIVLDVGAGSGILSFFAVQAGAKRVYAVEASSMAEKCEELVTNNKLSDRIIVIPGKVEEVEIPEKIDTIISEPMGYMLFNERMLESFLHAKKWLKPGGKMFPSQGDLHISPFTDEALFMEQYSKANFCMISSGFDESDIWSKRCQQSFHGIDLGCLRSAAVDEYFKQPIVDTFDIRICMAKSYKYTVDFQQADEKDLHVIDIPLTFTITQSGMVHGLAFWFDVAFLGSSEAVWLSTSPTETLTHWYQVRCLLQNPILVKQGQTLMGKCVLRCNTRQSYDVDIELNIPGTSSKSQNTLDLKNPFFRYTGQPPQPPPGMNNTSPSENYWNTSMLNQTYMNGIINGMQDQQTVQMLNQQAVVGVVQQNLIPVSNISAPINPGSIPSVINLVSAHSNRTSVGGGISPVNFAQTQAQSVMSGGGNFPVSNQFMIGDYVMPGNVVQLKPESV